jgi:hypothetical protein
LFVLTIIGFFVFAISGVQLLSGGYIVAGVPALVASGIIPLLSSFWSKRRQKNSSDGHKKKSKWDICDCLDLGDCGCGCD